MKASIVLIPLLALALAGVMYSGVLGGLSDENLLEGDLVGAAGEARQTVAEKLGGLSRDYGKVLLDEEDLRSFVLASLAAHPGGRKILERANGIGARVVDGEVELRLLVNVAAMREGLSAEERELFDRAVATSRMAEDFDVDLLVQSGLSTSGGSLGLNPDAATLKLSLVTLDLHVWTDRVGYSRRDVDRLLQFQLPGYKVKEARVLEDGVELAIRRL